MKIYKVVIGHETDEYGYSTAKEIAKYFFDKEKAEKLYKSGEFTYKETQITSTFDSGYVSVSYTGVGFYEREKKNAKPWEKVELVERISNHYKFEEIEVEE
jgi:hypothetical protein